MKKVILLTALAICVLVATACYRVEPGYIGIRVHLLGSENGDIDELPVGQYGQGANEAYYSFPVFAKTYTWTKEPFPGESASEYIDESFTFQSKESMAIEADISLTLSIDTKPGVVKNLFQRYRRTVDEIMEGPVRNAVRDEFNNIASKYSVEDIIGEKKETFLKEVEKSVRDKFSKEGIIIESLGWANKLRPPKIIEDAINAKNEATQKAMQLENEVRSAEAEAQKRIAEARGKAESAVIEARAEAESNRLRQSAMTDQILKMEWIKRWDGKLPTMVGQSSGFMVDLR